MREIYIYGLYNNTENEIRYIGKTNKQIIQKRLNEHIYESFRNNKPTHKNNWIKYTINNGGEIYIKLIEITDDDNWQNREKYWISYYKNLTNSTEGGEGGCIYKYTITYDECKKYINENFIIKSYCDWKKNILLISSNIPKCPDDHYLNKGWISWGNFLNTNRIANKNKKEIYLSYDDAKKWVNDNLDIETLTTWREYTKETNIPIFIPKCPDDHYLNKGWISWGNFLNTNRIANKNKKEIYLSYDDACKIVRDKKIKSRTEYIKAKIQNIHSNPRLYYKEWLSWGVFLGTGRIQDNILAKNYISYDDAKEWIKNNIIVNTYRGWKKLTKENKIPYFIPNNPNNYYKKRGWKSWCDFLNNNHIERKSKKEMFLSYDDACEIVRSNNIKSQQEYVKMKLSNIPAAPNRFYNEWKSWGDFLGTGRSQDNLLALDYFTYGEAKKYVKNNLSEIKSEKYWKEYVKDNKIPNIIPNHPKQYYQRKNRGWISWYDFLNK